MPLGGHWTVFVVRKIIPAEAESLHEARARIVKRLVADRRRRALTVFTRANHDVRWALIVGPLQNKGRRGSRSGP
jgi:hypothetical protein